ncbi:MAG: helix-turn-helix transcriptional regulator [Chlorobiaceae bacterium]|nr:helix-turn-helix transcriptional regulator [Chlorobiaceae bacterium]
MPVDNVYGKIAAIASKEPSGWLKDAQWRKENQGWLKRSQYIALKILRTIRERKMSQKDLAELIGVTPQHINKIVKGRENLTLETISILEKALGIVLVEIPEYITTMAVDRQATAQYVSAYNVSAIQSFSKKCPEPYGSRMVKVGDNENNNSKAA